LDVVSTLGAVTTVALGAGGGSNGSLTRVVVAVGILATASFILALDLVGGMYLEVWDSQRVWEGWDTAALSGSSQVSCVDTWQDALVGRVVQLQRQLEATGLEGSRCTAEVLGMCGMLPGRSGEGGGKARGARLQDIPIFARPGGGGHEAGMAQSASSPHHEWANLELQATL